ncbi:MAG: hypothetical protein IJ222_10055 [Bacteroidales bacterium]|nr:hypothetical protein [Bacteroidales bacterium]
MKKHLLTLFLLLFSGLGLCAQSSPQKNAVLDSLVLNYVEFIQPQSVESKQKECDFLINSVNDEGMRSHIAQTLFEYYKEPPVMGDEEVAIYIYDKWFASGPYKFDGEFTALEAEMFVNLNRNTMLGMDAPLLNAVKPCGGKKTIPAKGGTSILWFYDTACSKCRIESKLLPGVLERGVDFPVTLVAFYTGADRKAWREFRRSFKVDNPNVRVEHYWDRTYSSDYQRLYAVVDTPKMYVVAPEGSIIGRRLELDALVELLPIAKEIDAVFSKKNKFISNFNKN